MLEYPIEFVIVVAKLAYVILFQLRVNWCRPKQAEDIEPQEAKEEPEPEPEPEPATAAEEG